MTEQKTDTQKLHELLECNNLSMGLDFSDGFPRINVNFPSTDNIPLKTSICKSCRKPATEVIIEPRDEAIINGVKLRFVNSREWKVEGCLVNKIYEEAGEALDRLTYDSSSEEANLFDNCIENDEPLDMPQDRLKREIRSYVGSICLNADIEMRPPLASKIRKALSL